MLAEAAVYPSENTRAPSPVCDPDRCASVRVARTSLYRSIVVSTVVHLGIIGFALFSSFGPPPLTEVVAMSVDHSIDVNVIPISALETLLPRGVLTTPPTVSTPSSVPQASAQSPSPPQPHSKRPLEEKAKTIARKELPKRSAPLLPSPSAAVTEPQQESDRSPSSSVSSKVSSSEQSAGTQLSAQPFGVPDGEAISLERARISYQDAIATRLARAKRYPERALRRRMTGEGAVRLEISSDGSIGNVQIIRSTNASILDDEIRAMVDRAAPFPAFPADLKKNKLALIVPIAFRLEG